MAVNSSAIRAVSERLIESKPGGRYIDVVESIVKLDSVVVTVCATQIDTKIGASAERSCSLVDAKPFGYRSLSPDLKILATQPGQETAS